MKSRGIPLLRALVVYAFAAAMASSPAVLAQDKDKDKEKKPEVSSAEIQAMEKINNAPDAATKLQMAGEFVKKHPKSVKRGEVARYMASEIAKVQDPAQRITLAEGYLKVFSEAQEAPFISVALMDAYVRQNRVDDAFRVASTVLEKNPEDVPTLTQMAITGSNEIKRGNPKYAQQTNTYALKAIELIEADKKPTEMDAAAWNEYKTKWLGTLYHVTGFIALASQNKADAKARIEKAVSISPDDPMNYILLGSMVDEEYQQLAQQSRTMMAGPAKDEVIKKAHEKMDQVIDMFAHAMGLMQGKPEYQAISDQLRPNLETYYKYRHNNSTEGLQQLIDKYKKQ